MVVVGGGRWCGGWVVVDGSGGGWYWGDYNRSHITYAQGLEKNDQRGLPITT